MISGRSASRGFTLLELIVVMVIAGMIVAVGAPMIANVLPGVELKATTKNIASALRYTRNQALSTRQEQSLVVDSEKREYYLSAGGKNRIIAPGIELSLFSAETAGFSQEQSVYTFYPSGGSTGGRITLSRNDAEYSIDIDWLTGRVQIIE